MLLVVDVETRKILFRVDAWDSDCELKAINFMRDNGLKCVKDEITMNGDRIAWCKEA